MKGFSSVCVFLSLGLFMCTANPYGYDGKPGCRISAEVGQTFRNFWDPTKYWLCVALNQEAISERCADGNAFLLSAARCVSWIDWVWEPNEMTPKRTDDSAFASQLAISKQ